MKPCIFLDIDGVINPSRQQIQYQMDYTLPEKLSQQLNDPQIATLNPYLVNQVYASFSKESLNSIQKLIETYDACIVITSSWRIVYSLAELQAMFNIFNLGKYVVDTTEIISPRTKAIREYIQKHHVTSYVILDDFDMSSVFDYHFIYVHNYFNAQDYQKADYALQIQKKEIL